VLQGGIGSLETGQLCLHEDVVRASHVCFEGEARRKYSEYSKEL
jgi:hypothetical protein